jgi:hypothetical protein
MSLSVNYFIQSMASATTFSSGVDLQKAWNKISVEIPTMASGSDVYLQGSIDGTTYRRVCHAPNTNSATVGGQFVTSGVTNVIVPFNNAHVRFVRIELSSATSDTPYTFNVICSD